MIYECRVVFHDIADRIYTYRKLEKFLKSSERGFDEEFLFKKLSTAHLEALKKTAADFFATGKKASTFEASIIMGTKGSNVWKKYNRLKRIIMNEDIPLWNKLIKKNSGLQMADMELLFRKRRYYDSVKDKLSKKDKIDEGVGEELMTMKELDKDPLLICFNEDYFPSTFWIFKMYGPPAAPHDSQIFRGQLSNGPKKVESMPTATSASLMMTASDGPPDLSSREQGKVLSRAEARNAERLSKEAAVDRKRHEDMVKISMHSIEMETYHADLEIRK